MGYALKNTELFEKGHSLAEKQIFECEYPWQVLPRIKEIILEIGKTLPADRYDNPSEGVWIAKSAKVSQSASISGPCIIEREIVPGPEQEEDIRNAVSLIRSVTGE